MPYRPPRRPGTRASRPLAWLAAALALSFLVSACDDPLREAGPPRGLLEPDAPLMLQPELARGATSPEELTFVLRSTGGRLHGIRGTLTFDPGALEYVGQDPDGAVTVVNTQEAGRGILRVVAFDRDGLGERPVRLAFRAVGRDPLPDLRWSHDEAAGPGLRPLPVTVRSPTLLPSGSLPALPEADHLTADEWADRLGARRAPAAGPARVPGEFARDLTFGDVDLSCTLDVFDVLETARFSVGLVTVGAGSEGSGSTEFESPPCQPAGGVDRAVAANVHPVNAPGLGEVDDDCAPGVDTCGSPGRSVGIFDVLAIAEENAGNDQPVVGETIPGRRSTDLPTATVVHQGTVGDAVWSRNVVHVLRGTVRVSGGTLVLEPGTFVLAETADAMLVVERDGRLVADGTLLEPIHLTCAYAEPCTWAGVVVAGNAPVSGGTPSSAPVAGRDPAGGCNVTSVGLGTGGSVTYGGCAEADDSGVLRYVVIDDAEPGLSLLGVGSGTTVDYLHVHDSRDRALDVGGGTVDLRHTILAAAEDTALHADLGWSGRAQFLVAQVRDLAGGVGLDVAPGPAAPSTAPELWNVAVLATGGDAVTKAGLRAPGGAGGSLHNVVFEGPLSCRPGGPGGTVLGTHILSAEVVPGPCMPLASGPGPLLGSGGSPDNPDFGPVPGGLVAGTICDVPPGGWFDASADFCGVAPPNQPGRVPWFAGWSLARYPVSRGGLKPPTVPDVSLLPVSGDGQTGEEGATLPDSLAVVVLTPGGHPVSGVAVTFDVVTGGGALVPMSVTTDSTGVARAAWTLGTAGPNQAEARLPATPGAGSVPFSATATSVATSVVTFLDGPEVGTWAADNGFDKRFEGAMLWGKNTIPAADFEYAVREFAAGADRPLSPTGQFSWSQDSLAADAFEFVFDGSADSARISVGGAPVGVPPGSLPVPGNLLGRWVDASGAPITSASVGDTVRLQVCTTERFPGAFAVEFDFGWSGELALLDPEVAELESDGPGVHPDCRATASPAWESFLLGFSDNEPAQRKIAAVDLDQPPLEGSVGIASIPFEVGASGTATVTLDDVLLGDGAPGIPVVVDATPLCVGTTGCAVRAPPPVVNTLLVRVRATGTNGWFAVLDATVELASGEILFADRISGDGNSEYVAIQDQRLMSGFRIFGTVALQGGDPGSSADPIVQLQAGRTNF